MGILEEIRVGYDLFRPGGSEPPGNLFIQGGFEYEIYSVVEAANREHKSTNSILLSLQLQAIQFSSVWPAWHRHTTYGTTYYYYCNKRATQEARDSMIFYRMVDRYCTIPYLQSALLKEDPRPAQKIRSTCTRAIGICNGDGDGVKQ